MRRTRLSAILILLVLASVGLAVSAAWAAARGARAEVSIAGGRFVPAAVTIAPGDSVTWVNDDDRDHAIEADDGSFSSGKLKAGQSFDHRFTQAGTHSYSCSLHPREKGKVVVKK